MIIKIASAGRWLANTTKGVIGGAVGGVGTTYILGHGINAVANKMGKRKILSVDNEALRNGAIVGGVLGGVKGATEPY